ncbi:MAG: hypothetical protein ACI841_000073 [Planctomycetota bacterium]
MTRDLRVIDLPVRVSYITSLAAVVSVILPPAVAFSTTAAPSTSPIGLQREQAGSRPAVELPQAVTWEWGCRWLAMNHASARQELSALLKSPAWHERALALQAMGRAASGLSDPEILDAVVELTGDAAPNVRLEAFELLRLARPLDPRVDALLRVACDDSWPAVRLAAIRSLGDELEEPLGSVSLEEARATLLRITLDDSHARSEAERRLAREALLAAGPSAWREQIQVLTEPDGPGLLEVIDTLRAGGVARELLQQLREAIPERRGIIELLGFELYRDADLEALGEAWIRPLTEDDIVQSGKRTPHEAWLDLRKRRELFLDQSQRMVTGLGRALFEAAEMMCLDPVDDQEEHFEFLCRSACSILGARRALHYGVFSAAPVADEVWAFVRETAASVPSSTLRPWLEPQRFSRHRHAAAQACARSFERYLEYESIERPQSLPSDMREFIQRSSKEDLLNLLVELAGDHNSGIQELAFRSLCRASDPVTRIDTLFTLWMKSTPDEQFLQLRELPRGVALWAFREELIAWNDADRGGASVPELLSAYVEDAQVLGSLVKALTRALNGIDGALAREDEGAMRAARSRARSLLLALGQSGGATPVLLSDLKRSLAWEANERGDSAETKVDLGKHVVAALARTSVGRSALTDFLGKDTPSRVRIESALALASEAATSEDASRARDARVVLLERFEFCDSILRSRSLRVLRHGDEAAVTEFAHRLAIDDSVVLEERTSAMDLLALRGEVEILFELLQSDASIGLRRSAVEFLMRSAASGIDVSQRRATRERLRQAALERLSIWTDYPSDHPERVLTGDLFVAVCATGGFDAQLRAALLTPALRNADRDLSARHRGKSLAVAGFSHSSELSVAGILAKRGELSITLDRSGPWWQLDGRFLLALAQATRAEPEAMQRVANAAWIALVGEAGAPDRGGKLARLALMLWRHADEKQDWTAVVRWGRQLRHPELLGDGADRAIELDLGQTSREDDNDPLAEIRSSVLRARAWSALNAGRKREAMDLLLSAGRVGDSSARARAACLDLQLAFKAR